MAMKTRDIKYLLFEGLKNIWINGIMSIASIGTVVACLVMMGIFILFSMNVSYFSNQIKSQFQIIAFVDETVPDSQLSDIGAQISKIPNVDKIELVTKQQALDELKTQITDNKDILSGLESDNPLRNSFRISLKNLTNSDILASQLEKVSGIVKINNNKDLMDKIIKLTNVVKAVSFWILVILVSMTIVIISNTIKVALFARRKEINIMKFIGATDWFIRFPYLVEGIVIGLIGSILAYSIILSGYTYIFNSLANGYVYLFRIIQVKQVVLTLGSVLFIVGAGMGAIGSIISMRKYLKV